MSWHESVAQGRRRGEGLLQGRRGFTVKARGRAHRVTGCVVYSVYERGVGVEKNNN